MQRKSLTGLLRKSFSSVSEDGASAAGKLYEADPAKVGDTLETTNEITIRQGEDIETDKICTLGGCILLEVLEVGGVWYGRKGRRLKVKASTSEVGWISEYTAESALLVRKALPKLNPGDKIETTSAVMLRKGEELESGELFCVDQGIVMEVVETGVDQNVKVMTASGELGWITRSNKEGGLLVKMLSRTASGSAKTLQLPAGEDYLQVYIGEQLETLSVVVLRSAEALDSDKLAELRPGIYLEVLEIGGALKERKGRRLKVKCPQGEVGWMTDCTVQGELLVSKPSAKKSTAGRLSMSASSMFKSTNAKSTNAASIEDNLPIDVGSMVETNGQVTMRAEESATSDKVTELAAFTALEVLEIGGVLTDRNGRRLKVKSSQGEVGWITDRTVHGELLVSKPSARKSTAGRSSIFSSKSNNSGRDNVPIDVGTLVETTSQVTMRAEESVTSDKMTDLSPNITLEVLEIGGGLTDRKGRRLKVKCPQGEVGWITDRTMHGEALVRKAGADQRSTGSTSSRSSRRPSKGRLSMSSLRRSLSGASNSASVEEDSPLRVDALVETVSPVTMRALESVASEKVSDLGIGICVVVLELGDELPLLREGPNAKKGRRLKVKTFSGEVGWISQCTNEAERLVKRSTVATMTPHDVESFVIGTTIEVVVASALNTSEAVDSAVATKAERGSCWDIVEISKTDRASVKVKNADRLTGWLRIASADGEGLIRKVNATVPDTRSKGSSASKQDSVEPFFEAVRSGDIEAFKRILDSNPQWKGSTSEHVGKTALLSVAATGSKEMVESLLSFDPSIDVNTADGGGRTVLHHLASNCVKLDEDSARTATAQLLLDKGANAGAKDSEGKLPEDVVANLDCKEFLSLLRTASGNEDAENETVENGAESASLGGYADPTSPAPKTKKKVKKPTAKGDSPKAGDSAAPEKTKKKSFVTKRSEANEELS